MSYEGKQFIGGFSVLSTETVLIEQIKKAEIEVWRPEGKEGAYHIKKVMVRGADDGRDIWLYTLQYMRDATTKMFGCMGEGCENLYTIYVIKDSVWVEELGLKKTDVYCLRCVGQKLGRRFKIDDFTDAACNKDIVYLLEEIGS